MNFRLTPPLFFNFFKRPKYKKVVTILHFFKNFKIKKSGHTFMYIWLGKKSGHNFLKTYILKNQPQLFKKHTYFEIRKTSLSKKNKKAMQTLRWTPPPPTQTNMNNLATPPPPRTCYIVYGCPLMENKIWFVFQ